jgi:plasmid stabilization system protein ParE
MTATVRVLGHAQADIDHIYLWLQQRSPGGAASWYAALFRSLSELGTSRAAHSTAPESTKLSVDLRQMFFKTRRGRTYRLLFVIRDDEIRVLRVRGPGQRPVTRRDLPSDDDS